MVNVFYLHDCIRDRLDAVIISQWYKTYIENVIDKCQDESWGIIEDICAAHSIYIIWNDGHPISFTVDEKEMNDENTIEWTTV